MQINPTTHRPLPELRGRAAEAQVAAKQDEAQFSTLQQASGVLQQTPDVRPEEVARARSLIEQSTYPPEETIQKIANLMAMHLKSESDNQAID